MLITSQKGHDIFSRFCCMSPVRLLKVHPISLQKINSWKGHLFLAKKLNVLWMISVWNKSEMSFYLPDKNGVACDLVIVQKCCINCKLLAWKHYTFHPWLSLSFQIHQVAWEQPTALFNHTFQQYIHSHILEVIAQNTSAVCTTQLVHGPGSNWFQSTA